MGKWLAKFSADIQESLPDIPDILPSVSGLSGPDLEVSPKITTPHPADELTPPLAHCNRITWQGADGREQTAVIDFVQTYPGEVWAFCTRPDGEWTAVNVKYIRKVEASL